MLIRPRRLIHQLLLAVAALALLVFGVRTGLAFALAGLDPAVALAVDPHSAQANATAAEVGTFTLTGEDDVRRVEAEARRALASSVYTPFAVRSLGLSKLAMSDPQGAARLLSLAGDLSKRDIVTHTALLNFALGAHDAPRAVMEADNVLRQSAVTWKTAIPALATKFTADPAYVAPLARALARQPNWRGWMLTIMGTYPADAENKLRLLQELKRIGSPPTVEEQTALFSQLANDVPAARLWPIWRSVQHDPAAAASGLRDGSFEAIDAPPPFVWRLANEDAYSAEIRTAPAGGLGKALLAQVASGEGDVASQTIVAGPGRYQVTAKVRSDFDRTADAFSFVLRCRTGKYVSEYGTIPILAGADRWTGIAGQLTIPTPCDQPILAVHGRNGGVEPQSIWIDDVTFRPIG